MSGRRLIFKFRVVLEKYLLNIFTIFCLIQRSRFQLTLFFLMFPRIAYCLLLV